VSAHPTDQALFEAAQGENPDARDHVKTCKACVKRYMRLAAGAALISTAKRESFPPVDWTVLDARMLAVADRAAAEVRAGVVRPIRRFPTVSVTVGVALAAAAAGVFAFRMRTHSSRTDAPIARSTHVRPPTLVPSTPSVGSSSGNERAVPAVPMGVETEAVVLLAAAPASHARRGATAVVLTGATHVREGDRVSTGDEAGRVVLAVHSTYRVDVRRGTEVIFASLRSDRASLTLTKGTVRVEGPDPGEHGPSVGIEAAGWTMQSKGGAFTAAIDGQLVRVRVLSGKISVRRGDGAEREVLAGAEIELAHDGGAPREVSQNARDVDALDMAALDAGARDIALAPARLTGDVSFEGSTRWAGTPTSTRPARVVSFRVHHGNQTIGLRVDPAASAPAAWTPERSGMPPAAVASREPIAPAAQTPIGAQALTVPRPGLSEQDRQRIQLENGRDVAMGTYRFAAARCFVSCANLRECGSVRTGSVGFHVGTGGHVTSADVRDFDSAEVVNCLRREALRLPMPVQMAGQIHVEPVRNRNP